MIQQSTDYGDPLRTVVTICALDNPITMAREAWADGQLICSVQASVIETKGFNGNPQFPFMLNYGPWYTGQYYGDLEAVDIEYRPASGGKC